MGMFDYFQPDPALSCPNCGGLLDGFQGMDGPSDSLVWRQGVPAPIDHSVDDHWQLPASELAALRLPERFELYATCERCRSSVDFTGFCTDGVWSESILGLHLERETTIPARSVAPDWRQCTRCAEAWEHPDAIIRAGCPYCHALTRLEP